ncbi:hypothetical protein [Candidatus Solirubrobacter pratensis]|uniref:hypothetical protein n=1 Tax=Candidatus Solirubrobacter pratensis TaxID=1298857 RepID=UPI0012DCA37A|nr:hypothetical protein [Candidatus Solirubrobacter pratensis]
MPETWTIEQAATAIADGSDPAEYVLALTLHIERGKGIALYRNEEFGHPGMGHTVGFTYGTSEAQFETPEPPVQCPDGLMREITGGINWRYRLAAVVPPEETA